MLGPPRGESSAGLLPLRRLQKAAKIRLAHRRLPWSYVVETPIPHPSLELADQIEEVIERVHDEQQRLVVVDLEVLVDHPLQLDGIPLHLGRIDRVGDLAVGAEQAAAVHLESVAAPHQPELDGEPEEPRHRLEDAADPPDALLLVL